VDVFSGQAAKKIFPLKCYTMHSSSIFYYVVISECDFHLCPCESE